ncbi:MAG: aminopeptidase P family protein [Candidatus Lokiarchaeota archaeon]|nr:aminopeptidase P family protein [Candidatus Lokiarchaeota archaeon]
MTSITNREFQLRIEKTQKLLRDRSIQALFCTLGTNFQYLLNAKSNSFERLVLAIINSNGTPHLICPAFELQNYLENTPLSQENISVWEEIEDPFLLLKKICIDYGIHDKNIAISPQTPFTVFSKIKSVLPHATFVDALPIMETARIAKTDQEIELMKKASHFSARGIEAAFDQLVVGITEKEASALVEKEMSSLSEELSLFALVQFGANSSNPHGSPSNKKLKKDEVVLIDAGTSYKGYVGDITNTTVFGKPNEKFLEIYNIVEEANHRATTSGRLGILPSQVDAAARDYIIEKGYGQYFTHRTGHGIGLDVHEAPYIIQTNLVPLGLSNTYTIEPGIYLPGKFGVRIEDDVFAKTNGCEQLSFPIRRYWEN